MEKILLLDWDGPVSNSRTWKMPGFVDPVAIQLLNDAAKAGWKTVLSSTIRKHYDTVEEADRFMKAVGLSLEWYSDWRTPTTFTAQRHLEVLQWMSNADINEDAVFLVVDDERFPRALLKSGRMVQIHATSHSGLDYLGISEAYQIFEMDDTQLAEHFGLQG